MMLFTPDTHDMGWVPLGAIRTVQFTRPPGGSPIRKVSAGCGCTQPRTTDTTIEVTYYAPVQLPPAAIERQAINSPIVQYLTVYFQNGQAQTLTLSGTLTRS